MTGSAKDIRLKRATRLLACGGLLVGITLGAEAANPASPMLHKPAPEFVRKDIGGRAVNLRALRGKVVLLNFWATWCAPCLEEMPQFKGWQERFGPKGFEVIAVSMDDTQEPVRVFAGRLKPGFPVVMGDEKLGNLYGGILGLPMTYLIGRDGRIEGRLAGATDMDALEARIQTLLQARLR